VSVLIAADDPRVSDRSHRLIRKWGHAPAIAVTWIAAMTVTDALNLEQELGCQGVVRFMVKPVDVLQFEAIARHVAGLRP
jgi:response regulator of citrate/malate metabolism